MICYGAVSWSDLKPTTKLNLQPAVAEQGAAVHRAAGGGGGGYGSHEHRIMSSDDQSGDDERMTIASFDDDATSAFGSNASSSNMTLVQLAAQQQQQRRTRQLSGGEGMSPRGGGAYADISPRSMTRAMRHRLLDSQRPPANAKQLMAIRLKVFNSGIFDHVLRLATAGATGYSLEPAFAAVDILLQCMVQPDVRAQLGPIRGESITRVFQTVLFGADFGLAVLAGKGLIAVLEISSSTSKAAKAAAAAAGPMTFKKAVRVRPPPALWQRHCTAHCL
jgi:hypothetical protein